MEKKIFIVTECSNVSCECDFTHTNLKAFTTYNDALNYLADIERKVNNKTLSFFRDEFGWLDVELVSKGFDEALNRETLIYSWYAPETGKKCFTKFYIEGLILA